MFQIRSTQLWIVWSVRSAVPSGPELDASVKY